MALKWSDLSFAWQVCLEEAWAAYCVGSLPIGAALLDEQGRLLLRERNHIADPAPFGRVGNSQLAHAELNVLLQLNRAEIVPHSCTLYSILEPCPLCMGAFYMSGVRALVYAARDPYAGSTNLLGKTEYLSRKPIRVHGPEPAFEPLVIAFQVAAHAQRFDYQKWAEFYAYWARISSSAEAHGRWLHDSGELRAAADAGLDIMQVFDLLTPPEDEGGTA